MWFSENSLLIRQSAFYKNELRRAREKTVATLLVETVFYSLFVTVIFSDSKRLFINSLQKLAPFSEKLPRNSAWFITVAESFVSFLFSVFYKTHQHCLLVFVLRRFRDKRIRPCRTKIVRPIDIFPQGESFFIICLTVLWTSQSLSQILNSRQNETYRHTCKT